MRPASSDCARTFRRAADRFLACMVVGVIRLYQTCARPLLGGSCRFFPTCSEYAVEAMRIHGTGRGALLTIRRLLRCRPFGPSGYDPVPPVAARRAAFPAHPHCSDRARACSISRCDGPGSNPCARQAWSGKAPRPRPASGFVFRCTATAPAVPRRGTGLLAALAADCGAGAVDRRVNPARPAPGTGPDRAASASIGRPRAGAVGNRR
jgi:putative membrane protein insertion efficiency factor